MTIHHALLGRRGAIGLTTDTVAVAPASLLLAMSSKLAVPFRPVPLTGRTVVIGIRPASGLKRGVAAVLDKPIVHLGLIPFIPGDIMKAMLAALVFPAALKWLSRGDDR